MNLQSASRSFFRLCLLYSIITINIGHSDEDISPQIPIITLDKNLKPLTKLIPILSYKKHVSSMLAAIHNATIKGIIGHEQQTSSKWEVQTIAVGVGMSGEVGLGPIWHATGTPRIKMVFTNSTDPIYPAYR